MLWLPLWLPQRIEGGRSSGSGGGGGGGGKAFNLLTLFSSDGNVAAAGSGGVDAAGRPSGGAPGSLPASPSVDSMLERPQRTLSYDDARERLDSKGECLMLAVGGKPGGGSAVGCELLCSSHPCDCSPASLPASLPCVASLCPPDSVCVSLPPVSEAGTEWSDGVAVAYKAQQQRQHGVGFATLIKTPEVWAICAAQYTGAHIF